MIDLTVAEITPNLALEGITVHLDRGSNAHLTIKVKTHPQSAGIKSQLTNLTYEIELQPGEQLTLPQEVVESVGAGQWLITIQPKHDIPVTPRSHDAFLNGSRLKTRDSMTTIQSVIVRGRKCK